MKHIDDGSADAKPVISRTLMRETITSAMKSPKNMALRNKSANKPRSTKNQRARAQTFTFKKDDMSAKKVDKVAESGIL